MAISVVGSNGNYLNCNTGSDHRHMTDRELKKNSKGYPDPTAYKAIKRVEKSEKELAQKQKEDERFRKLLDTIFAICEIAGFKIEGRITLRDVKSGRVWR